MVALPQPTIDRIYAEYKKREADRPPRKHLGGSEIGEQCDRRLWYSFRHAGREKFEGRMLRLFDTGHRFEAQIIADLRAIGCTVWDVDPSTGEQWRFTALDGHLSGGLDGVLLGLPEAPETPHLLECKSMNRKNFDKLEKEGVEKAKPVHFAQMQLYMGLADLTRAAYVVACKDDDRLYLERVNFDDKAFKALLLRAKRIIGAEGAPERISNDHDFYVCRFCPFNELCHGKKLPEVNCRTCVHSAPGPGGSWTCGRDQKMEPGCGEHVFTPDLLDAWAEPVDGDPTWVKYRIKSTGREFVNVAASGFPADDVPHWGSHELSAANANVIGNPTVEAARSILGGEVVATRKIT